MENNSNIGKNSTTTGVCKGCGWQCMINALSCNGGRRLNGVPEVITENVKTKRPS